MGTSQSISINSKSNNVVIVTYNTKINYYSKYKCNKLINYLSNFKDKQIIICLQGIDDSRSKKEIINNLIPYFDINSVVPSDNTKMGGFIILTNFTINDTNYLEFDIDDNIFENNKKGVLSVDLKVHDTLVTVYNTELYEDISNQVVLNTYREKQLEQLVSFIEKKRRQKLDKEVGEHQMLDIILGSLYIDDIENENMYDIIKIYNDKIENDKGDYILFFMKKGDIVLSDYLKEHYSIEVIKVSLREEISYSDNLPFELILNFIITPTEI